MRKKYVVRLTDEEGEQLTAIVKTFKGSSQKVRRAQILLKADSDGQNWPDRQIADAFGCRRQTVENVRQHMVERRQQPPEGRGVTDEGRRRPDPTHECLA